MAQKAARRCNRCGEITRGRCERCRKESHKRYDDTRGNRHERGYDSKWEKVATYVRNRDNYLCVQCRKDSPPKLTPANIVDHIVPIKVAPEKRLSPSNCQVLCAKCHGKKTEADVARWGDGC